MPSVSSTVIPSRGLKHDHNFFISSLLLCQQHSNPLTGIETCNDVLAIEDLASQQHSNPLTGIETWCIEFCCNFSRQVSSTVIPSRGLKPTTHSAGSTTTNCQQHSNPLTGIE